MTATLRSLLAAVVVLALASVALADEAGDALKAKVLDAYAKAKTYQSTVLFEMTHKEGRIRVTQAADYKIAFDREAGKIKIDNPTLLVVNDGKTIRMKSDEVAKHHLEIAIPKPFDYAALTREIPFLKSLAQPDLIFLLAADPVAAFAGTKDTTFTAVAPDAADPRKRPGLRIANADNTILVRLDPATNLITAASMDVPLPPDEDADKAQSGTLSYDIKIEKYNTPLDADTFAFDAAGSSAETSLEDYVDSTNPLLDKPAPELELTTIDGKPFLLSSVKAQVIVLDFWATWCPPCVAGLPKLQHVAEWARRENKSVAFFAVNQQETPDRVKAFITKTGLTLPVLMDPESNAGNAYKVKNLPQTVVINRGVVIKVTTGLPPDEEQKLTAKIEMLLKDEKK